MANIREEIISAIKSSIKELASQGVPLEPVEPVLEKPKDESNGDYSTNIAMVAFRISQVARRGSTSEKRQATSEKIRTPMELAEKLASSVQRLAAQSNVPATSDVASSSIEKVEAVAPGFINFWLSKEYLSDKLQEIRDKKEKYGGGESLKDRKIMVEFTDPNPFKEFHIGHLYSNTVGESASRLLEALGAIVKRANYQGDVGMHIAKSLYAILQISNLKNQISNLEKKSAKERAEFLGQCYATGAKVYEEDKEAKKEIEELNKKIYAKDEAVMALYEKGRQWSLEYFETIYKRLGTKFDFYYFESEVGINGLKLVQEYLKKGVFEKSQGAVIFPGKKQNLHDRVFVNSLGLPTYEAKELGLALKKYEDFKFDQSIVITGNEIIGYFRVLLAALGKIEPDLAVKTKHLPHGMVRLPTGKMSSRSGNILTGEWLLDEAKKLLKNKFPEMEEATLEKVAVGSVKYALLKSSIGHDIEFNFEESINLQGNSGTYLQYAYARTQSVLAKIKNQKSKIKSTIQNSKLENEEMSLLRELNRFSEIVEEAGEKFAPNILCTYLFDLAQKFNLFYQKHKIIVTAENSLGAIGKHPGGVIETQEFRVALTAAVGQVIKNGLCLLGIQAPEKM